MDDESPQQFSDSDEIVRNAVTRLQQINVWLNAAQEHLFSEPDSVIGLAVRLKWWRNEAEEDGASEELRALKREYQVEQLKKRIFAALDSNDIDFLRRLAEASALSASEITEKLKTAGAIVLAFQELRNELGRRPNKAEVRVRVDRWFKEGGLGITDRHWKRVFDDPFIAALFRAG